MTTQIDKAELLRSLHIPGTPLILSNVWDAVTARIVADAPGVRAIASASHAVSYSYGVADGEGLTLEQALVAAKLIVDAVDLPVTIDFERAYAPDAAGVEANVRRLIETGAVGLNLEDSDGDTSLFSIEDAASRVAAARAAGKRSGVPIVINARVDALIRGAEWPEMIARANAYLASGADVVFVLGLGTEDTVKRALAEIDGKVSVMAGTASVPLRRLAELGISRVSFGPGILGLALSHIRDAAETLTALGDYPSELAFPY